MLFETTIILALSVSTLGRAHQKRYGTYSHHHHDHIAASSGHLIMPSGGPYSSSDIDTNSVFQPSGAGLATPTGVSAAHDSSAALVTSVTTKTSSRSTSAATELSSSTSSPVSSVSAGESFGTSSASTAAAFVRSPSPASSSVSSLSVATIQARTSAASTASAAASTSSTYSGIGYSVKRGIPYDVASLTGAFNSSTISWAYNWDQTPAGKLPTGVGYVPMLWDDGPDHTTNWNTSAQSAIDSGARALLSFNEPDLASQANMSPSIASAAHIKYMNQFAGKAEIVSPAIGNNDATDPPAGAVWLQQFFDACAGRCKVDAVAFHWYDAAWNIGNFKLHTNSIIKTAAANGVSKVWLTEFQAAGNDSAIIGFISDALPFLESTPAVERYAWLMCDSSSGSLLSGTELSDIGKAYVK